MNISFPYQLVDLTHDLSRSSPSWDAVCGFSHNTTLDYSDCDSNTKFRVQEIQMSAGIGTHIDSPSHCKDGGLTVAELELDNLIAPLIVIDVHHKITDNYIVSEQDIFEFEEKYGKIQPNSFVAFYTGWSKYWNDPTKYHNNHIFPSISTEVANILISRKITGIGIDTLSPDANNYDFPVHNLILGANKYIIENIAQLDKMPHTGAFAIILPMKAKGLTESPVRMIGLLPQHQKI